MKNNYFFITMLMAINFISNIYGIYEIHGTQTSSPTLGVTFILKTENESKKLDSDTTFYDTHKISEIISAFEKQIGDINKDDTVEIKYRRYLPDDIEHATIYVSKNDKERSLRDLGISTSITFIYIKARKDSYIEPYFIATRGAFVQI